MASATSRSTSRVMDLKVVLGDHAFCFQPSRERDERAVLLPLLDLGLRAIEFGVEHRMRAEAIRTRLDEKRSLSCADRRYGVARRGLDGEHVHAIHRERRDAVARGLRGEIGDRLGDAQRRAHRVEIVFADEEHRQPPERGEVHGFMELALGRRAFAEEAAASRAAGLASCPRARARPQSAARRRRSRRRRRSDARRRRDASSRRARGCIPPACQTSPP